MTYKDPCGACGGRGTIVGLYSGTTRTCHVCRGAGQVEQHVQPTPYEPSTKAELALDIVLLRTQLTEAKAEIQRLRGALQFYVDTTYEEEDKSRVARDALHRSTKDTL